MRGYFRTPSRADLELNGIFSETERTDNLETWLAGYASEYEYIWLLSDWRKVNEYLLGSFLHTPLDLLIEAFWGMNLGSESLALRG